MCSARPTSRPTASASEISAADHGRALAPVEPERADRAGRRRGSAWRAPPASSISSSVSTRPRLGSASSGACSTSRDGDGSALPDREVGHRQPRAALLRSARLPGAVPLGSDRRLAARLAQPDEAADDARAPCRSPRRRRAGPPRCRARSGPCCRSRRSTARGLESLLELDGGARALERERRLAGQRLERRRSRQPRTTGAAASSRRRGRRSRARRRSAE